MKNKTIDLGIKLSANDFIERATGLIAKRGKGKSGLLKVVEEELYKLALPFVVFDPTGIHWGIKSSFDGSKPSGHEVLIIGGPHGDLPLDRHAGRIVARAFAETYNSLIVDFKGSSHAVYRQFIADFADELLDINKVPRLLILEEAPRLLPQKLRPDQTQSFDAVARLILEGRNSGLGCILVSQRAATLNKDVLTQVDNLIVMGLTGPQDRKAIKEWVEENADPSLLDEFLTGLAGLSPREAWLWSPDMDIFKRFHVKDFTTFHPDRTHLRRMGLLETDVVITDTKFLVEQLGEELQKAAEDAKQNDPAELKRRISKLEKELEKTKQEHTHEYNFAPEPIIQEVSVLRDEDRKLLQFINDRLGNLNAMTADYLSRIHNDMEGLIGTIASVQAAPKKYPLTTANNPPTKEETELPFKLVEGHRKILRALIQFQNQGGLNRSQITTITGQAVSTRNRYLSDLLGNNLVLQQGEMFFPKVGAYQLIPNARPLPEGDTLIEYWLEVLPSGHRKILETLVQSSNGSGGWMMKENLDRLTGQAVSTRNRYISDLKARYLVEDMPGAVRLHPNLYLRSDR